MDIKELEFPIERVLFLYDFFHFEDMSVSIRKNINSIKHWYALVQAVLKMLAEIGAVENIPEFLEGVKNRCSFLIN